MSAPTAPPFSGIPPHPRTRFIGRETERALAVSLLVDDVAVLPNLTGPRGIGKTRLALAIIAAASARFADDVAWVDFAPVADPLLVAATATCWPP